MKNHKILLLSVFLLVGIFLTLLLISNVRNSKHQQLPPPSGTISKVSPTQQQKVVPTSPWKVYTQSAYNFQFTYPSSLFVQNTAADSIAITSSTATIDPDAPVTGIQITVTPGNTINDHFDLSGDLFTTPTVENVVVGGMSGKAMSGYGVGMLQGKYIKFVDVLDRGNTIQLSYFDGDPNINKATFEQILTSFKFK